MKTKFELMRANRERVLKVPAPFPALPEVPEVPFMEIDGVRYLESKDGTCRECAFGDCDCSHVWDCAEQAFGGWCTSNRVIYIKAAS